MNKLEEGKIYEKYVRDIIKHKYKNVWLWEDVPNYIMTTLRYINNKGDNCDDIGCDLICETYDSTYEYIQCKNYLIIGNDNIINILDLSGFYNFVAENEFIYGKKVHFKVEYSKTQKIKQIQINLETSYMLNINKY